MKLPSKKNILIAFIALFVAAGVYQAQAAPQPDLKDFITGASTNVPRIGSLLISDIPTEGISDTTFGDGKTNEDYCNPEDDTVRGGTCLEVSGLGFMQTINAEVPVSVLDTFVIGEIVPTFPDTLDIDGQIMDWSLAFPYDSEIKSPRDEYESATPSGNLRYVCSDEHGRLIPCGVSPEATPPTWDFDFYTPEEVFFNPSGSLYGVTQNASVYNNSVSSTVSHFVKSFPLGSSGPHSGGVNWPNNPSYLTMFKIDPTGDFDDIECEYSDSPIGHNHISSGGTLSYDLGPRSMSSMRWDPVSMVNAEQNYIDNYSGSGVASVGIHSTDHKLEYDANAPTVPFYAMPMFDVPTYDFSSASTFTEHLGYSAGVIRCRIAETATNARGTWKYHNAIPPRLIDESVGLISGNEELTLTRSGSTLSWDQPISDTVPPTYWYSVYRQKCDFINNSYSCSQNNKELITSVQATTYTVSDMEIGSCSKDDEIYKVIVTMCNPNSVSLTASSCYKAAHNDSSYNQNDSNEIVVINETSNTCYIADQDDSDSV